MTDEYRVLWPDVSPVGWVFNPLTHSDILVAVSSNIGDKVCDRSREGKRQNFVRRRIWKSKVTGKTKSDKMFLDWRRRKVCEKE